LKRRFQIYMRMVDLSFWVTAVFLARFVSRMFGHPLFVPSESGGNVLGAAVSANLALAVFVILARFMRDEHAERIWQQTARRFVNTLVAGSALAVSILPAIESRVNRLVLSRDWQLPPDFILVGYTHNQTIVKGLIGGFGMAIMVFGFFAPLIFIVLYKWALWRDSR
jgi:hypothetical protein